MSTWLASLEGKAKDLALDKLEQIKKPECHLKSLGFKNVTRKNVEMASTLTIKNPYDHELPIFSISYKIISTANNKQLGHGSLSDSVSPVKGNDSTDIELPTTVEYDFLWTIVKDIGSDWDIDYRFDVDIEFNLPIIGKHTLPLHHAGTIKLPTISDIL